jgi:hypothetical protein
VKIIIRREDLTAAEMKAITERYDGYHHQQEFWTGFVDYQNDCNLPNRWPNSDAGEAWDQGTEAAMRVHWERYSCMYARDDLDSRKMIGGLDSAIEKLRKKAAKEGLTREAWLAEERKKRAAVPVNDN